MIEDSGFIGSHSEVWFGSKMNQVAVVHDENVQNGFSVLGENPCIRASAMLKLSRILCIRE
jgi:hypothetical protein